HEARHPAMASVKRRECALAVTPIRVVRALRNHSCGAESEVHVGTVVDRFAERICAAEEQSASKVTLELSAYAVVVRIAAVVANGDRSASRIESRQKRQRARGHCCRLVPSEGDDGVRLEQLSSASS